MTVTSFIELSTRFILDQFPTYVPWAEANSMFMLNSVCPKAFLPGGGTGIPLTLNFLGIGPSRLAFKSTVLNHITKPILRKIGVHLLPPKFTSEGMYGYFNEKKNRKLKSAVLIRDEASGMIVETRKQYLADELTFLTELVDGELTGRKTVSHGFQKGKKIVVIFICCGTPHIFTLIDTGFWAQGLGNRLIPIYWIELSSVSISIPFQIHEFGFTGKLQQCADLLKEYQKADVGFVEPDDEVKELFRNEEWFRRDAGWRGYQEDKIDITPAMYYECNVFIKKIAGIKAIDRQKGEKNPIIEKQDFIWAKNWVKPRYEEFEEMYKDWASINLRRKEGTLYVSPITKILRAFQKHPGGLTKSELNNCTRISAKKRKEICDELLKQKMLVKSTKFVEGKPVKVLKLKEEK